MTEQGGSIGFMHAAVDVGMHDGKRYFRLVGAELKDFKSNKVANSDPVTSSREKEVILWTERGTVRGRRTSNQKVQ